MLGYAALLLTAVASLLYLVQERECKNKNPHGFFFLMTRRPPRSPLFPNTTLFRSCAIAIAEEPPPSMFKPVQAPSLNSHWPDRKSTRLNSSHLGISYAVFCLTK